MKGVLRTHAETRDVYTVYIYTIRLDDVIQQRGEDAVVPSVTWYMLRWSALHSHRLGRTYHIL